jgi:hypothetical protein
MPAVSKSLRIIRADRSSRELSDVRLAKKLETKSTMLLKHHLKALKLTELITQLMEVREEHQLMRMKSQLAKLDVLILDELRYVPASKLDSELLFDVISTAHECDRDHQSTPRTMDGSARQRATNRRGVGPSDAPRSHLGGDRRELPSAGCASSFDGEDVDRNP